MSGSYVHAARAYRLCRVGRCVEFYSKVGELFGKENRVGIVIVLDRNEYALFFARRELAHVDSACGKTFVESFRFGASDTKHLAGRLHFRTENRVCVVYLFKAEYRHLYGVVFRVVGKAFGIAELFERFAHHYAACKLYHGNAGNLADVRHGPARPGIDFYYVELVFLNEILYVDDTLCAYSAGKFY